MKIAILGTGAYGIALALMFNENTKNITMWTRYEKEKNEILQTRQNNKVLKDVTIPENINITSDMKEAVEKANIIVIAVPAGAIDEVSIELKNYYKKSQHICIASKGIEQDSCRFVEDVVTKHIKTKKLAVISGGSFAIDIVKKVPIGLSLATKNKYTEKILKETLQNQYLKLRSTKDILGIEVCGSIKNVIAIASGILNGLGYPESTQCMFITESLHDIKNLIKALGGSKKTILSFAGFGDLLLTCTSYKSRNFTFGKMLGEKRSKEEINNYMNNTTIEGLYTLKSIYKLIKNKQVDMPIIDLIYNIIYKDTDPNQLAVFLREKI